jgi:hypothetical protein
MSRRKRTEPVGSQEHFVAFEVATGFKNGALINKEKAAELLGLPADFIAALEPGKILVPAGKAREEGDRRLYCLKSVVILRNDPAELDRAVDAIIAATSNKNAKKAKRTPPRGGRRLGRRGGSAD